MASSCSRSSSSAVSCGRVSSRVKGDPTRGGIALVAALWGYVATLGVKGLQQGIIGGGADDGVRGQVVIGLEAPHSFGGAGTVDAVGLALVVAKHPEDLLNGTDVGAGGLAGNEDPAGEDLADDVDCGAYGDLLEELLYFPVEQADTAMANRIANGFGRIRPVDAVPDL